MEQSLWLQARQFLLALALGLAVGVQYDLLRGLRQSARWMTHLLDFYFALSYLAGNLLFALYFGGGEFRIFMLLGSFLGMIVYFLTVSRCIVRVSGKFWSIVTLPFRLFWRLLRKVFIKVKKITKNIFSSVKKSVTIKKTKRKKTLEGMRDAPAQIVTHYKAADPGSHAVRDRHNRHVTATNKRVAKRKRKAVR